MLLVQNEEVILQSAEKREAEEIKMSESSFMEELFIFIGMH